MSRTFASGGRVGFRARLAAFALLAGALLLVGGSPAVAAPAISINPGSVPTTAAEFTQDCDPNLGGGPFDNQDVWVFVLPGNVQVAGTFLSVTATFSTPGGTVTLTIPTPPDSAIVTDQGTSKAWIRTPAGWTLIGATAEVSGAATSFNLSHTCAASNPPRNLELSLTKTGTPATGLKAGQRVTYTYTVTNESTGTIDPITGVTVTDDTVSGITCLDTSLTPGESTTCTGTYTVTEEDVANGKIVNVARATGLFGKQTVPSNQATFTVTTVTPPPTQASLSIDKKARVESDCRNKCESDGFAAKGDRIFYTYRVTNTGTVAITNVAVDDPTAGPVVCNSTTLAPGTSTDCHAVNPYVVSWADVKAGKVVDTARATGRFGNAPVVSDPDTVTICIRDGRYDHRKPGKDGWNGKGGKPELPVTGDNTTSTLSLGGGLLLGASRLRRKARFHA